MRSPLYRRVPPRHRPAAKFVPGVATYGALSGSANFVFSASGVLTGTGALTGTSAITFAASGVLTDAAAPPTVVGGGGDRGVNLFREKPGPLKPKRIPAKASFAVRFDQPRQTFDVRFEVESEFKLSWLLEPLSDFELTSEAESEFTYASEQEALTTVSFATQGIQQRSVPVRPIYESIRTRVEFETGDSEMEIQFEVEA